VGLRGAGGAHRRVDPGRHAPLTAPDWEAVGLVADLWRFPVKSFGGERVRRAFLAPFGLLGDRRFAVVGQDGMPLSARRASSLLGFTARCAETETGEGVEVETPEGLVLDADDPMLARLLGDHLDREVRVLRATVGFHDAAAVHLVTDASLAALEELTGLPLLDRRRFRANVIVELADPLPFAEADWPGRELALGPALVGVLAPTERCAVTTFDPDTLARDTGVLAALARERDNLFGVYAQVMRPGWVRVGDPVRARIPAEVGR
jgi:MOSC domain-containing protein